MKKYIAILVSVLCAVVLGGMLFKERQEKQDLAAIQAEYLKSKVPTPKPQVTGEFITEMMARCGAGLSAAKTAILRDQILRVIHTRIDGVEAQQAFVYILCIESKYQQKAKSKVGAIGVAQLMPQYVKDFAAMCGLGDIKPEDAQDTEVNLHLGACYFNKLVKDTGNIFVAAASYNAGPASASVKNLKALGNPVHETAGYIAKVAYLKAEMEKPTTDDK